MPTKKQFKRFCADNHIDESQGRLGSLEMLMPSGDKRTPSWKWVSAIELIQMKPEAMEEVFNLTPEGVETYKEKAAKIDEAYAIWKAYLSSKLGVRIAPKKVQSKL